MITLCVPTKNRSAFLGRLLHYYATTGYRGVVFIGDSSDAADAMQNQQAIEPFHAQLTIRYVAYPGLSSCAAMEQMGHAIATPYCAYVADDDFLCPRGIDRCLEFLDSHPEYSAAHGEGVIFQIDSDGPYGTITNAHSYPQAVLEASSGAQRLLEFIGSGPRALLQSVHRTDTWRAMFQGVGCLAGVENINIFKDELIPSCIAAIRGRVKSLQGLSLVRHAHGAIRKHPSTYDWITHREWFPSYEFFRARVTEELVRQDGIGAEEAQRVIREIFWPYLGRSLMRSWQKQRAPTLPQGPSRMRTVLKRVPGMRRAWQGLRAIQQRWRDELSLPALLRQSSPYHGDFIPIYRVLTTRPADFLEDRETADRAGSVAVAGVSSDG